MNLNFERFDGRSIRIADVVDRDSGIKVGYIQSHGVGFNNTGGIDVSLFDNKYQITAHSYDECLGFVRGVESVLKFMTAVAE